MHGGTSRSSLPASSSRPSNYIHCTAPDVRFRPAAACFPKREGCYHTRNRLSTTDVGEDSKQRFRKVLDFNPILSSGASYVEKPGYRWSLRGTLETAKHTARVLVQDGDQSRTVPIETFPFTIGRQADRDLSLLNPQVSRQHAVIERDGDGFVIRDLGSRHGTLVNGLKIEMAQLQSGDRIQPGASNVVLVFVVAQDHTSTRVLLSRIAGESAGSQLEKLSLFLQAAQSFNNTRVLNEVLNTMVEYTLRLTGAERGFVFLGDSLATLRLECGLNNEGLPLMDDSKISHSIVRDAAESGQEYIVGDVSGDGHVVGRESMVAHELRSVIAIPLRGRSSERLLGLLYLDSRLRTSTLNRVGRDILQAIASEAANLVENARMMQAERDAELLRKEMEIAASIQQSIMARELPDFQYAKVMARSVPCTEVGGDFYDVIPVKDGFVAIVADVSGKGMSAALLASIIQGMMYAQIMSGASLVDTVNSVNSFLCARVSGQKYVTLVAAHYRNGGSVELVNGGHVCPFVVGMNGQMEEITDGDMPIGLFETATFHSVPLIMPVGARLVLLSDGVSEAENPAGVQFGSRKLEMEFVAANPIESVFSSMHCFCEGVPPHDDRTMLVVERTA
ncbi:serine phosphatase RsbU (regulator of sigma subunit) [Edaphobacter aggregans]|uniref:Serine phosphatase RsbU (Regulator of sigma subunit) n=2 Tax=Edaphobacter aggregans TaxID=570835 RepID=A0A428MHW7_9BACT|nr:serine phosphatase RsbU (regulator of sigma subunit) [Edaphobacter aggregans]